MELMYKRDLEHNYMVIKCADLKNENIYAENIFKAHSMESIITYERRYINSSCNLYYKTDSLVSLYNKALVTKLGIKDLKKLFKNLFELQEELKEYLLDISAVFLSADTVYFDLDKEVFCFIAFPYGHEDKGDLKSFAEELLDIINTDDEDAVTLAYSICEYSGRKDFRLKELRTVLDKYGTEPNYDEGLDFEEYEEIKSELNNKVQISDIDEYADFFENEEESEDEGKLKLVPFLIFIILLLASVYVKNEYFPRGFQSVVCYVFMGVGLLGAVSVLASKFIPNLGRKIIKTEKKNENTRDTSDFEWIDYSEIPENKGAGNMDMNAAVSLYGTDKSNKVSGTDIETGLEDCKTVLLTNLEEKISHKLYGRGKAVSSNISLEDLPFTVGSRVSNADCILKDKSVSRMHAHLSRDTQGRLVVKDLGSTNGTYHNGKRLSPNESIIISTGDEIRFGVMEFEYV